MATQLIVAPTTTETGGELCDLPLDVRVAEFLAGLEDSSISEASTPNQPLRTSSIATGHTNVGDARSYSVSELWAIRDRECRKERLNDEEPMRMQDTEVLSLPTDPAREQTSMGKEKSQIMADSHKSEETDYVDNNTNDDQHPQADGGDAVGKRSRKRRYRNEQQKLSNSLAQKRYRERKKQAFKHMQGIIEQLSMEVESLQRVRTENERLMQVVANLEYVVRYQQNQLQTLNSRQGVESHIPTQEVNIQHNLQQTVVSSLGGSILEKQPIPLQQNMVNEAPCKRVDLMEEDHCKEVQQILCHPQNLIPGGNVLINAASPDSGTDLDSEWDRSMAALEKVLNIDPNGNCKQASITEDARQLLGRMVNSLCAISSRMMNAKIQNVVEENRSNTKRIEKVLEVISGRQ